jgi:hypothetical protein
LIDCVPTDLGRTDDATTHARATTEDGRKTTEDERAIVTLTEVGRARTHHR